MFLFENKEDKLQKDTAELISVYCLENRKRKKTDL